MQFSVIIPAKNEEANIGRCLESILAVDWPRECFELIVVDNGSSDRTPEIARKLGAQVFVQPELTISGLRNFGAARAGGTVLAFMDADCTVHPSWLARAAHYLERPGIVCFGSPPRVPPAATWVQRAWYQVRRKKVPCGETQWLESMNMFVRRDAFLRCGGFDEQLITCEDYDLSTRLHDLGQVYTDQEIVAFHFGEAASLGHFYRKELWRGIGNLKGVLRHGLSLSELPSLALPMVHCLALISLPLALGGGLLAGLVPTPYAALPFLGWQALLLALTCWKFSRVASGQLLQIYLLLNLYYLARGVAIVRHTR